MRPIEGVTGTAAMATGPITRGKPAPRSERAAETAGGRALIAVTPPARSDRPPSLSRRPSASFLAQLIATAQQAPQTRARRRADPDVAITSYRATATDTGAAAGYRLVRTC